MTQSLNLILVPSPEAITPPVETVPQVEPVELTNNKRFFVRVFSGVKFGGRIGGGCAVSEERAERVC